MTLAADLQAQSTSTSPSPGLEQSSKALSPISPPSPPRSDRDQDSGPTSDDESEPRTPSSDISTTSWPVDSQTGKPLTEEQFARIRAEEPLHLPPSYMAGYFPGEPGMKLKEGRYRIILKLGWMRYSSTWLVEDTESDPPQYYTAKIGTVWFTNAHKDGVALELECMQAIQEDAAKNPCLPLLIDHFEVEGPHGVHMCLITNVLSSHVQSYRLACPEKRLTLHSVKYIMHSILRALVILEERNIIHTNIKPDIIMFADNPNIDQFLDDTPPSALGTVLIRDEHYPIMYSQPIPGEFRWDDSKEEHMKYKICLSDFCVAQRSDQPPTTENFSPFNLRAPEVILGGPITTKLDIWMVGCITFELLVGRWLFPLKPHKKYSMTQEHVARMEELTGQVFADHDEFLKSCKYRDEFFNPDGTLYVRSTMDCRVEKAISNYKLPGLSPNDIKEAAAFITTCLALDPSKRPLASELVNHPWLKGASSLDDYRDPKGIIKKGAKCAETTADIDETC